MRIRNIKFEDLKEGDDVFLFEQDTLKVFNVVNISKDTFNVSITLENRQKHEIYSIVAKPTSNVCEWSHKTFISNYTIAESILNEQISSAKEQVKKCKERVNHLQANMTKLELYKNKPIYHRINK